MSSPPHASTFEEQKLRAQRQRRESRKSGNDRHSSTGNRGLPKKGGGGGKGTWGKPGDELNADDAGWDSNDPNYDAADFEAAVSPDDCLDEGLSPMMDKSDYVAKVDGVLQDYFEDGDAADVLASLTVINCVTLRYMLVERVVRLAMDRNDDAKELASRLLAEAVASHFMSEEQVGEGFNEILLNLADMKLDAPDVVKCIAKFMARAVADDCLPPSYIATRQAGDEGLTEDGKQVLRQATVCLKMKHGLVRLDRIWGASGGRCPLKTLRKRVDLLLREYLASADLAEAERCVRQLDVPHFHHEIVYEAVVLALEGGAKERGMIHDLLKHLAATQVISAHQLAMGMQRLKDALPDLCLDIPDAFRLAEAFQREAVASGYVIVDYPLLPSAAAVLDGRGRKRYVSQGDGGMVKEEVPVA